MTLSRIGWAEPPKVSIKVNPNKRDPPISTPSLAIQEMVENGKMDSAQVHFSYVTNKVEPLREDVFREVFQHFGFITDIRIKKSQYDPVRTPSLSKLTFSILIFLFFRYRIKAFKQDMVLSIIL